MSVPAEALLAIEQLLKRGEFEPAVQRAQALLGDAPDNVAAARLLGAALRGSERYGEANEVLSALAERHPEDVLVQNSLGAVRRSLGDLEGARDAFRRACSLAPEMPPFWFNYALVQFMRDEVDDGLQAIDRVVALAPDMLQAHVIRADMLREHGRVEKLTAEHRATLARNPQAAWAWFGLANLQNVPMTAADVDALRAALGKRADPGNERSALQFALAKALDDTGRYAEAFALLADANAEVRERHPWDAVESSAQLDELLTAFTPVPAGADVAQGSEVIFVVSLPRSGSTLAEQILASHSQVEGAGEHGYLNTVLDEEDQRRGGKLVTWAREATPDDWRRLGERYLEITAHNRRHKPRFTDKALSNWRLIGAIRAMLPAAPIIICHRDPLEVAFSCYRQWFNGNEQAFSYDFSDMAAFSRDFDRASAHWRHLHPGRVLDLVYEDLVRDQEGQTRSLLRFCGLEFEESCLNFHANTRRVTTISASQVREPMRSDTARADRYGALLDPLRLALGLPAYAER